MNKGNLNKAALELDKLDSSIQYTLKAQFFTNYDRGLLRIDIKEQEVTSLSDIGKYNLFYICYMKSISVIPTVEMVTWINKTFNPDYDICGGAGNLGFCLGIPTSDSYFRLNNKEFDKRVDDLQSHNEGIIIKPDFTLCTNTNKITGNAVAKLDGVSTVIGSWILVQNPDSTINTALDVMDNAEKSPDSVKDMDISARVINVIKTLAKKGRVGVPNGVNLKGLLKDANLVFIGNFNTHHRKLIKELYEPFKHKTYSQEALPFFIIDKQYLRGNKDRGFIKFFPKTSRVQE